MKKRVLSLALTLVLCLALAVPALAESAVPVQYAASVDGGTVTFDGYQIADQVYIRLRDVAFVLDGFDVAWDGQAISITTGTPYASPNGTELAAPFDGGQSFAQSPSAITVDGFPSDLTGILLTDLAGNGYCYFTPDDLAFTLGIALAPADPDVMVSEEDYDYEADYDYGEDHSSEADEGSGDDVIPEDELAANQEAYGSEDDYDYEADYDYEVDDSYGEDYEADADYEEDYGSEAEEDSGSDILSPDDLAANAEAYGSDEDATSEP